MFGRYGRPTILHIQCKSYLYQFPPPNLICKPMTKDGFWPKAACRVMITACHLENIVDDGNRLKTPQKQPSRVARRVCDCNCTVVGALGLAALAFHRGPLLAENIHHT